MLRLYLNNPADHCCYSRTDVLLLTLPTNEEGLMALRDAWSDHCRLSRNSTMGAQEELAITSTNRHVSAECVFVHLHGLEFHTGQHLRQVSPCWSGSIVCVCSGNSVPGGSCNHAIPIATSPPQESPPHMCRPVVLPLLSPWGAF